MVRRYIASFFLANRRHAWLGTPEIDDSHIRSKFFTFYALSLT